jgi:predicted small lipoprotein YifL
MYPKENELIKAYVFGDIPMWVRIVLVLIALFAIMSIAGCGTSMPIEQVQRQPPAADMVRLDPLPHQTDPSLGGIFKGYVNAAQKYRGCTDRLAELQDWVNLAP